MLKGSIVALITPFHNNIVDTKAFTHLLEWHLSMGTQGILVGGTTGEAPMLTADERQTLISIALTTLKGKVPIIVGCGTSSTAHTLQMIHEAETLGADAALVIAPYYVKPSQEGIIQHFKALHDETHIPIIVYNNPGRVGMNIDVETMEILCQFPSIIGFKDSHNDATRMATLRQLVGDRLILLSGEDSVVAAHMLYGADGAMSVMANIIPTLFRQFMDAWDSHDIQTFTKLTHVLNPLSVALGKETNPCTIKYAGSQLGLCTPELRLPLTSISHETEIVIKREMTKLINMK